MKKAFLGITLASALAFTVSFVNAADTEKSMRNPAGNPIDQFTGEIWVKTSEAEKKAFIFGIDSAITVEYFIDAKMKASPESKGKKGVYTLSPFEKGWMQACTDMHREEMVNLVSKWYAEHPSQLDRPVLSVIWNEIIAPRLAAEKI